MVSRIIPVDSFEGSVKSATNKRSRERGKEFESIIETACEYYSLMHIAEIEKTPESRQVVGRTGDRNSKMICINAKKAQPDFKGTASGGKSVVFEAKHTDDDRMMQSRVTDTQAKKLDRHHDLGADTFILLSFGMNRFYRVPYVIWKGMKERYGRRYVTQEDIREYQIPTRGGILMFLD